MPLSLSLFSLSLFLSLSQNKKQQVGYGKRLPSGALAKVRAESTGLTSLLYEQELSPLSRLALCSQFDATNLDKPPKVGVNIALKN